MIIPGYDVATKLGEGGTASVWKARQLSLNRVVAIKLLTSQKIDDPDMFSRFRMEAESTARLNHPGIVQIYDMGEFDQCAYLVMEFVDGESLDTLLFRERRISTDRALSIASQVASAMAYAWDDARLVHCDLKPGNILLDEKDRAKVSDLGVARLLGKASDDVDSDMITGTPYYVSPEQATAGLLDARSDIYSLGATLYHAVTGKMPFEDEDADGALKSHGSQTISDPLDIDRTLSPHFVWLLDKMMMVTPEHRPTSWAELVEDIERVKKGRSPTRLQEELGLSTIARSAVRPPVKKTSVKIQMKTAKKPNPVPGLKSSANPSRSRKPKPKPFLRPALQQLLTLVLLTGCVYGVVAYLSEKEAPVKQVVQAPVVQDEDSMQIIRPATKEELMKGSQPVAVKASPPKPTPKPTPKISPKPGANWSEMSRFEAAVANIEKSVEEYKLFSKDQNQARLDTVEELARAGLDVLEDLRSSAPASVNVSKQVRKGYLSISNARQSRKLELSSLNDSPSPKSSAGRPGLAAGSAIDDLFATAGKKTAVASSAPARPRRDQEVSTPPYVAKPIKLSEAWNPELDFDATSSSDLVRVLQAHGQPQEDLAGESSMTFPSGVGYRMPVQFAAARLQGAAAGREALRNPAMPQRSLLGYRYEGAFGGGFDTCLLIVDLNGQVVGSQLTKSRLPVVPSLPRNLYLDQWGVADLISGKPIAQDNWKVAHRVRRVAGGVVVESEAATPQRLEPRYSSRLYLPQPILDMLLLRNIPPEPEAEAF